MDDRTLRSRAATLAELHQARRPLVLPTVWDVWSARVCVEAGFEALTVGSHPLAESRGARDEEGQSFEQVLEAVAPIIEAVPVPVSLDLEAGYGRTAAELIAGLLEVGGAGLNIEDTVHSEGGRVRTTQEHSEYIAELRAAAEAADVPVWINGRTDLFLRAEDRSAVRDAAIERLQALVEAGADSVYPVGIGADDDLISAVVSAVDVPVNITAHPVDDDLARLRRLGVGRVSYGPRLQASLTRVMRDQLARWR